MLFSVPVAPAPLNPSATAKAKFVRLKIDPKDDISISGYDPWWVEFFWKAYPTNTDATNNTNGVEVARGVDQKMDDTLERTKGTTVYYRCFYVDQYGNISAGSATVSAVYRGANDGDVDKTTPGTPTGLTLTQVAKNTDTGDGKIETAVRATWTAPGAGVEVKRYILEITDGTDTWIRYAKKSSEKFPVVIGKTYTVKVSAESIFGEEGSPTTGVGITPTAKSAAPGNVTSVSIVVKGTFNRIKWTPPSDKDLAGANVYFNTVNNAGTATLVDFTDASKYDDTTARTAGTVGYWFVAAVNRSGVEGTRVAASNNPQTARNVINSDIATDTIQPSRILYNDTSNQLRNPEMDDLSLFVAQVAGGFTVTSFTTNINPTSGGMGNSKNYLEAHGSAGCTETRIMTLPDIPVTPEAVYSVVGYVGATVAGITSPTLRVVFYEIDGTGALVQVGSPVDLPPMYPLPGGPIGVVQIYSTIVVPAGAVRMAIGGKVNTDSLIVSGIEVKRRAVISASDSDVGPLSFGTSETTLLSETVVHGPDIKLLIVSASFKNGSGSVKTATVRLKRAGNTFASRPGYDIQPGSFAEIIGMVSPGTSTSSAITLTYEGAAGSNNVSQMSLDIVAIY